LSTCLNKFPQIEKHPYKIIAFDWDGTAVENRSVDATEVAHTLEELLKFGVYIVVITGTNFGNINRQFSSLINGPHKKNLFICTNRGSEVFGFDDYSEPVLLYRREATDKEEELLSKVAEAVKHDIESKTNIPIDIVYNRLNRRKIDLIPEWENPPKSQIGELLVKTEERLKNSGYLEGIKGAYGLAEKYSREFGLNDARLTSDVKHVEVGLTDKSDSMMWVINDLAKKRNIPFTDILVLGDEFGPIAGFEGSDFRTYFKDIPGITYVSVGKEPNGVPEGILHTGGGPACFLEIIRGQVELQRKLSLTEDPAFLLTNDGYEPLREHEIESLFTIGNGYLGTRGSLEERRPESEPGTLLAGVFDRTAPGEIEELVLVPDWVYGKIYVDGKQLALDNGRNVIEHRRMLDMKKGAMWRFWRHRGDGGKITRVHTVRFASLANPHAFAMKIIVEPENYRGEIRVETGIEVCQRADILLKPGEMRTLSDGRGVLITTKTRQSDITIAQAQFSRVAQGTVSPAYLTFTDAYGVSEDWRWQADVGQAVEIEKFVSIYTTRDVNEPVRMASQQVLEFAKCGFNELFLESIDEWLSRWDVAAITIEGDEEAQLWANFAAYHLIIAGTPFDGRVSISARTLTGTIYKGHVFWDTEVFMLPFFIYTHPPTARALLMYRYHTLSGARKEAKELSLKGALYAWESTSTGEEMTPEYVIAPTGEVILILSGKMEQHINSAVAYGVWTYWTSTRDDDFFVSAGAEILIETARFWASRAEKKDGVYHIYNVEGPDEYHEIVNDSIYTNLMAAWNIRAAADAVEYMKTHHPEAWLGLKNQVSFDNAELVRWDDVATRMYSDMNEGSNIIEQFEGYFKLKDIDVYAFEPHTAPLDTILGREETAASRLVKQADVVLLLYLLDNEFSEQVIKENYQYYERRTAHGSSLSPSIYGLVAARLGLEALAMRYFHQAGTIDLSNNMGNAAGGVHGAALGGLWQQIIMGFGGVHMHDDGLYVYPKIPAQWKRLTFTLVYRGTELHFDVERERRIKLTIGSGTPPVVGILGRPPKELVSNSVYRAVWDVSAWQEFTQD
jgi:kojibiose phosphorylase